MRTIIVFLLFPIFCKSQDFPDSIKRINDSVYVKYYSDHTPQDARININLLPSADSIIEIINSLPQFDSTPVYSKFTDNDAIVPTPIIIDDDLYQLIGAYPVKIQTCREYRYFKKDFPHFIIPKKIQLKFKNCK